MILKKIMGRSTTLLVASLATVALVGCNNDSDDDIEPMPKHTAEFEITLTNLTAGQPFSPVAAILHNNDWHAFSVGSAASSDIELLAESGDNSGLLTSAQANNNAYMAKSGTGVIGPGGSETLHISTDHQGMVKVSLVSMLVNTNDAIAALNGIDLSTLHVGDSVSYTLVSYDAGTEANTETADTIPGPAAAGGAQEGYNAQRDDVRDQVYVHAGVVTASDGLNASTLTEVNRWDNPVATAMIRRIQ